MKVLQYYSIKGGYLNTVYSIITVLQYYSNKVLQYYSIKGGYLNKNFLLEIRGCSQIMSAAEGGEGVCKILTMADKGGRGIWLLMISLAK